ncbi:MAG: invasion associated locus B family protein [Maritimibacter sp.]
MKSNIARGLTIASLSLFAATGAFAQESTNRVAANTDWSVFAEGNDCWSVSLPKQTVNTKNGSPVSVNRGDILLFVTYRKGSNAGEVSFTGGYPFANGSKVTLQVGATSFDLFTENDWAWSAGPEADAQIIASMKKGASASLVGRSSRGTRTEDTFSLLGFTASVDDADKRCK